MFLARLPPDLSFLSDRPMFPISAMSPGSRCVCVCVCVCVAISAGAPRHIRFRAEKKSLIRNFVLSLLANEKAPKCSSQGCGNHVRVIHRGGGTDPAFLDPVGDRFVPKEREAARTMMHGQISYRSSANFPGSSGGRGGKGALVGLGPRFPSIMQIPLVVRGPTPTGKIPTRRRIGLCPLWRRLTAPLFRLLSSVVLLCSAPSSQFRPVQLVYALRGTQPVRKV